MTDLLLDAMKAKDSGDLALAKQLISQALIQQPGNEAAWMLMADVVGDARLRRNCLERVLAINPNNSSARAALSQLNTSPLSPISRGERDKPLNPPQLEKVPPFTPPFTWENDQEEFLALGDMTYPNLPGDKPAEPPEVMPTFDWTSESDEPDKSIQKIFDSISDPDLASQPLPDTVLNWQELLGVEDSSESTPNTEAEYEARLLEELVGPEPEPEAEPLPEQPPVEQVQPEVEDYTVIAEPQLGLDAFTTQGEALENVTLDYRMWDNPAIKVDRMVILSNKSIIYASPKESDVPHILGLFAEKKMLRDLLGKDARIIKLESIRKVTADPEQCTLTIEYRDKEGKNPKKTYQHELLFSDVQVLNEVIEALHVRLGAGFCKSTHAFSLADKIGPPLVTLLLIGIVDWVLIAGLTLLSRTAASQNGFLQLLVASMQNFVFSVGAMNLLIIAVIFAVIVVIWLLSNLRQPSKLIILEHE